MKPAETAGLKVYYQFNQNGGNQFYVPPFCSKGGLKANIGLLFEIIGCGSAIQASLIAFTLHDNSARPCCKKWNMELEPYKLIQVSD